jgi:phospholipid transport system substrate-binding protein
MRLLLLSLAALLALAEPARAADPAARPIERLDASLVAVTQAPKSLGVKGRYQKLAPAVTGAFDLPAMTAAAVGPTWSGFTGVQQRAAVAAFSRLTIASFAANFAGPAAVSFAIDPNVAQRGADRIVQARLIRPGVAPVVLVYQMHPSVGGWRIIDIYFGGVSQVVSRRADFAASLAGGGAPALIAHLNALADRLLS